MSGFGIHQVRSKPTYLKAKQCNVVLTQRVRYNCYVFPCVAEV